MTKLKFQNAEGQTVYIKKVVTDPGYCFEHSHWVATGAVRITYPTLKRAYYDLVVAGFRKVSSDVTSKDDK